MVFLIVLCIVQVGILWSSQSGSFPFLSSFFPDSKTTSQASLEEMKREYMLPYRVVLSRGYDQDHFVVPNGSDEYNTLWEGAREYLIEAMKVKPAQIQAIDEEKWGVLVANKPFYFEFKTQVHIDIVKWVLNIKKSPDTLTGISKFVLCPDDPDYNYVDTLYIREDNNLYTFLLTDYKSDALEEEEANLIYSSLKSKPNIHNYKIAVETGIKSTLPQDMIAPLSSNTVEQYTRITNVPLIGLQGHTSSYSDYDAIQMELFGEVRNDYIPDEDVYGSVVFKKSDSVYRLYNNSIVEYKTTGNQSINEKTKLLEAYQKAAAFIIDLKARSNYMDGINVYLSSIKEGNNSFIFKFDYSISQGGQQGEVPLLFTDFKLPNMEQSLDSAITLEANSKRVLQGRWAAFRLKVDKNFKEYRWNFPEYLDKAYSSIKELKDANLPIQGYGIYYVITQQKLTEHTITPSFVLFNREGSYYVPLRGQ